jgi:hypothetical protein
MKLIHGGRTLPIAAGRSGMCGYDTPTLNKPQ